MISKRDLLVRAAAPELLKVSIAAWHTLQSLLAVREGIPDDSLRATADALAAAIAKAEGRPAFDILKSESTRGG
jgi:hypothetical protein